MVNYVTKQESNTVQRQLITEREYLSRFGIFKNFSYEGKYLTFEEPKVIVIAYMDLDGKVCVSRTYTNDTLKAYDTIEDEYCLPEHWTSNTFLDMHVIPLHVYRESLRRLGTGMEKIEGCVKANRKTQKTNFIELA